MAENNVVTDSVKGIEEIGRVVSTTSLITVKERTPDPFMLPGRIGSRRDGSSSLTPSQPNYSGRPKNEGSRSPMGTGYVRRRHK